MREGERKGERNGGRKGGRDGGSEGGSEGARKGVREGGRGGSEGGRGRGRKDPGAGLLPAQATLIYPSLIYPPRHQGKDQSARAPAAGRKQHHAREIRWRVSGFGYIRIRTNKHSNTSGCDHNDHIKRTYTRAHPHAPEPASKRTHARTAAAAPRSPHLRLCRL